MLHLYSMKAHLKILLFGFGLFLTASVVSAHERGKYIHSDDTYVFTQHYIEKMVVSHHDLLAPAPVTFDAVLGNTNTPYVGLKLNHKALPLTKKIWLINCQIAFK